MAQKKVLWALLMSTCLLFQIFIVPVASAPPGEKSENEIQERQTPLTPSQFSLAATRFIVLLPFLPLLMFVPGMTAVLMPMFLALQDRLTTIAPGGINIFGSRPTNQAGTGSVSNQGVTVAVPTEAPEATTSASPTVFRFKRGLLKRPTEKISEGFKEAFDMLSKADEAFNLMTSSEPDCRRQAVCRMNRSFDPTIATIIGNMIEIFKLESKVEKLDLSNFTKSLLKEFLQAANTGLFQQDCSSVYSKCNVVVRSWLS